MSVPKAAGDTEKPLAQDNTRAVVGWASATGLLLGLVASRGLRTVSVIVGAAVLAAGVALLVSNWRFTSREWTGRSERARLLVAAAITAQVMIPLAVSLVMQVRRRDHPIPRGGELWIARAGLLAAAVATGAIALSSLVDWAYTHPRLRGTRVSTRPCLSSTSERWRLLTRNWLLHRMVSYTLVRLAAAVVVSVLVFGLPSHVPQPVSSVLAAAAALLAAYIFGRVTTAASVSQNPPLQVGDVVVLAEEYGTGVCERPTYYVVDVSLEGAQLRELKGGRPVGSLDRSHDRVLELKDVNRLLRARTPFTHCRPRCSGVNKYCALYPQEDTPSEEQARTRNPLDGRGA